MNPSKGCLTGLLLTGLIVTLGLAGSVFMMMFGILMGDGRPPDALGGVFALLILVALVLAGWLVVIAVRAILERRRPAAPSQADEQP